MALFQGKQEYIALDANNITLVFDSGNIVSISGNIFLHPPQGHPILYKGFKYVYGDFAGYFGWGLIKFPRIGKNLFSLHTEIVKIKCNK